MTAAQTIMLKLSSARQRLNELLQVETRSDEQNTEMQTLTAETVSTTEPELRAALAAEDDPEEVVTATADPETRERLEIRARTGIADFLSAAVSGREVTGAARAYADAVGCSPLGRLPLELFGNGTPETRAVTAGPAIAGPVEPAVPFVFQRSAAESIGIQMPTHGPGSVQIPRVTTAPPSDTLAKDAAAPVSAAVITLDTQSTEADQRSVRGPRRRLGRLPGTGTGAHGKHSWSHSPTNWINEVFNGVAAGLNGLFVQATDVSKASTLETYSSGIGRLAALVDGKSPRL